MGTIFNVVNDILNSFWNWIDWTALGTITLIITLIVVYFYTIYTKKIYKATFLPFIHLVSNNFYQIKKGSNDYSARLLLVNLGKGPAIETKIKPLKLGDKYIESTNNGILLIPRPDHSPRNSEAQKLNLTITNKKKPFKKNSGNLEITCKDQLGTKYTFIYNIEDPSQPKFLKIKE